MPSRPGVELIPLKFGLAALMICLAPHAAQADPVLTHDGTFTWHNAAPWFGGLSGAEISPDGSELIVVSDKGRLLRARLVRQDGAITDLTITTSSQLKGADGTVLLDQDTDAEGLAITLNGKAFVSFEHRHRVASLDLDSGKTVPIAPHPDFALLQLNSGLEALAAHPDGNLYTLPERSGDTATPFPLYAFDGNAWRIAARLPRRGPFLPVGADFDESGLLYLLERTVTPLGFRNRIRRFDLTAPDLGEITLLTSLPGQYDNLESITLWKDDRSDTHLTLISDDNFYFIQRTQIVEFTFAE
jgi:hypothetical protein